MAEGSRLADPAALVKLAAWLSPAFPVGAFAYSHGMEAAVRDGRVADGAGVLGWIEALLEAGSGWNDLVLLAEAHAAALAGDGPRLREAAELAEALAGSPERRMETIDLGTAFAQASAPWCEEREAALPAPYPVAVGALAARHAVPLEPALAAFAHAFAASLLSACVRLVPLGQREATAILARLEPAITGAAARAARSTPGDLGSAAILSEIAALRHETTSPRLFRT